jgi:citrate lyase beta subunit
VGAENHGELLLRVADQLRKELGTLDPGAIPESRTTAAENSATSRVLDPEDAALLGRLKAALAQLAAALGGGPEDSSIRPVQAVLEGVELVIRGELVRGNAARLPRLMPSFVYLVALPIVEQDRALELSRRTSELIDAELGRG